MGLAVTLPSHSTHHPATGCWETWMELDNSNWQENGKRNPYQGPETVGEWVEDGLPLWFQRCQRCHETVGLTSQVDIVWSHPQIKVLESLMAQWISLSQYICILSKTPWANDCKIRGCLEKLTFKRLHAHYELQCMSILCYMGEGGWLSLIIPASGSLDLVGQHFPSSQPKWLET